MKINDLFRKIDELTGQTAESGAVLWCERTAFIFLTVMICFAPHSIAVTQSAWIIGMLAWLIRLFFKPFPIFRATAIDYALWTFFAWSVISSMFSYAPDISNGKLRSASLFLIFYFVYHNLKTVRAVKFLAGALIFSAMFAVVWTPIERAIGRGVRIYDFRGSAFDQIGLLDGDTILQIDGKKVSSLEEMRQRIFEHPEQTQFKALVYRDDAYPLVDVPRERIKPAASAEESLGIARWTRSHEWRAAGFYGHFTTFAEVLQLIISLAFGIFIVLISKHKFFARNKAPEGADETQNLKPKTQNLKLQILLGICLALMGVALLLTATRASQFAFFVSAVGIVLMNGNRKIILTLAIAVLPLTLAGLLIYQQTRRIGFDLSDNSTQYRLMMWRDGRRLLTANAHNAIFGVGMDSIQRYWAQWGLYDNGWQPKGHFHSTLVQLAVERGLPSLIIWLTILGIYARTLWRGFRVQSSNFKADSDKSAIRNPQSAIECGIILGCFGGLIGFFTSGTVHYNLGDGEVAMVFYILMAIGIFLCNVRFKEVAELEAGKDIFHIIEKVRQILPDVEVQQEQKIHPADDDGIWYFYLPGVEQNIQIESSFGWCPFIVETDEQSGYEARTAKTVDQAVEMIVEYLESKRNEK
jgi:hypothetical protein